MKHEELSVDVAARDKQTVVASLAHLCLDARREERKTVPVQGIGQLLRLGKADRTVGPIRKFPGQWVHAGAKVVELVRIVKDRRLQIIQQGKACVEGVIVRDGPVEAGLRFLGAVGLGICRYQDKEKHSRYQFPEQSRNEMLKVKTR